MSVEQRLNDNCDYVQVKVLSDFMQAAGQYNIKHANFLDFYMCRYL
jgi:hypothetical protein